MFDRKNQHMQGRLRMEIVDRQQPWSFCDDVGGHASVGDLTEHAGTSRRRHNQALASCPSAAFAAADAAFSLSVTQQRFLQK